MVFTDLKKRLRMNASGHRNVSPPCGVVDADAWKSTRESIKSMGEVEALIDNSALHQPTFRYRHRTGEQGERAIKRTRKTAG